MIYYSGLIDVFTFVVEAMGLSICDLPENILALNFWI